MSALFEALDAAPADGFYAVVGVLLVAVALTDQFTMRRRS